MNDQEDHTPTATVDQSVSFNPDTPPVIEETQAPDFRVVFCEGCEGGATPGGLISMGVYSQYIGRPKKRMVVADEEAGLLREELAENSTPLVLVREFQVQMLFNLETAKAIHRWLGSCVQAVEGTK